MASKSPSNSPRHDRRRNGKKGDDQAEKFFKLGEIRVATDDDFEHFLYISDCNDGWIKKVDKGGLAIYQKECDNSAIKMIKVSLASHDINIIPAEF